MLQSLRKVGRDIREEVSRTWENLSEGWRELLSRSSHALTQFKPSASKEGESVDLPAGLPSWGVLAGEVMETEKAVIVRLEVPGMAREDCEISIEGNQLYVRGEKRYEREAEEGHYHVMERAYGSFQRVLPLPNNVDADQAEASIKNGVLSVTFPKTGSRSAKRIEVK